MRMTAQAWNTNPDNPRRKVPGYRDEFDRDDAATLGLSSGEHKAWVNQSLAGGTVQGKIVAGAAIADGGTGSGLTVQDTYTPLGHRFARIRSAGNRSGALSLRGKDSTNFIRLNPGSPNGSKYILSRIVNGVAVNTVTAAAGADVASGDDIDVDETVPGSIKVAVNGVDLFGVYAVPEFTTYTFDGFLFVAASTLSWEFSRFVPAVTT